MADKKEMSKEVGLRIRIMRKSRGMTQKDLADSIGQWPSSITMYENGQRQPDYETLEAIADTFNVPMSAFFPSNETSMEVYNSHFGPAGQNDDIRLLIRGLSKLTPEQVAQAKNVFRAMFAATNPDLFDEGEDGHETKL